MSTRAENILLYHAVAEDRDFPTAAGTNVTPENFERQMEFLHRSFEDLSLDKMAEAKSRRTVAVTFDDGYADNYTAAYPIIQKYRIPVTFFLTVSRIGRYWDFPDGPYPGISWEDIRAMNDDPLINFASHGYRHLDLTSLSEEESSMEIKSSRIILEENIGEPVRFLSYPHGSFNEAIIEQVRGAGYQGAFSVISSRGDGYSRRRILISARDNMFRFKLKLSPLYWPLRRLL
ncbi:MAG: polysaccharide deacetylase family protein [Candidatus Auribacterota bacterium]|nr:polysaccharide deacetylase family protein [Candidatus Auribacterota bacterium]